MHIATFSALAEFPARLGAHIKVFPAVPPPDAVEHPTAYDPVHHLNRLVDFEVQAFQTNLTRVLLEERPALSVRDFEAAQDVPGNAVKEGELDTLLETFESARGRTLSVLKDLTDDQWARTGTLDDCEMSVLGLVHSLCAHDFENLAVIHQSLARCNAG